MKRPMLYWGILFALGVVSGKSQSMLWNSCFCTVYLLVIVVYYKKICNQKNTLVAILGVVFFLIGSIRMYSTIRSVQECLLIENQKSSFRGKVVSKEVKNGKEYLIVKCHVEGKEQNVCKLLLENSGEFQVGDCISFTGIVKRFSKSTNYGGFDEEQYRWGIGIWGKVENSVIKGENHSAFNMNLYMEKLRRWIHNVYYACLDEKDASVACAMVLGEKRDIDSEVRELYQKNGIAHLIAISGLHIAMIGGVLYRLLKWLSGNFLVAAGGGTAFICLYGMMTGLAGSTVRAIVMLAVLFGADVFGRKYDVLSSVALALLVLVYDNTFVIYQPGFLLSFGAVLGIAWIKPELEKSVSVKNHFWDGMTVSVSVELMTLPVMLWFYYKIPIWSILLNVIVVPCMSLLLGLLIVCVICAGMITVSAAQIVAIPCHAIFFFYETLCKIWESFPMHTYCSGKPEMHFVLAYYVSLFAFLVVLRVKCKSMQKKQLAILCYGIMLVLMLVGLRWHGSLRICMMDVGQGDGFYIQTPDGIHMLVDGGSSGKKNVGKYTIVPSVEYFGAEQLDYVFVTHSDMDHYSGIYEMIEKNQIRIKHFVLPAICNPDEAYMKLVQMAEEKNIEVVYMKQGDQIRVGALSLECISPHKVAVQDKNSGSLALWLKYKEFDMIFTGDMDSEAESVVLKEYSEIFENVEVLKVAHHGSSSSSSKEFIDCLKPKISFVSVGSRNRYGHPTDIVLKRIENSTIYRTDEVGAVLLTTDGINIQIQPYKE